MLDMEAIKNFSIDKSDWKKVKFGDVVFEPKESVKDPVAEGIEHVVGLEHIDSEDIHLHRSAGIEESTTFTKKFRTGDVLFGRRRAYLKKAAKAEFEGICSGDITVMRAKEELLIPELLPFIVNNDIFFDFAITHSAGGLSPRVKFKDLASFELKLPPKTVQKRIVELLNYNEALFQKELQAFEKLKAYYKVKKEQEIVVDSFEWKRLDEITTKKISYGIVQAGEHDSSGMPYIKSSDLTENGIDIESLQRTSLDIAKKYRRSEVLPGDIVFSLRGNLGVMNIVPANLEVANLTQGTARISVSDSYCANYVKCAIETMKVQRRIHALSKGSTFKEISLEALRTIKIPVPKTKAQQQNIFKNISTIQACISDSKAKLLSSRTFQKSLISKVF
ncbi:restriction endonuclease subunit S [Vibrio vulnificus]|uniref:restriction endonuclease subunit S n=1 Tax=Vibrio vulnificus TaxID=672 RepID=UPI000CD096C9|nr:restriction endonuclease subunit S [Vibrio vulnificus]EHH0804552.1 restriction endonuclease subunit S [Vibrio vulnificus]POC15899.1 type I restriction endonuclease subunit S [Vibrio vulnificus]